jgi:hypothetical protein
VCNPVGVRWRRPARNEAIRLLRPGQAQVSQEFEARHSSLVNSSDIPCPQACCVALASAHRPRTSVHPRQRVGASLRVGLLS